MTTIATDGLSVAGDGRSTRDDVVTAETRKKVFQLPDGSIVGMAGRISDGERAVRALIEGEPAEVKGDYHLIRLSPGGKVTVYEGSLQRPFYAKAPLAIGSGHVAAKAAMLAGASARDAVKIAAKLDIYTGGKITSLSR